MKNIDAAVIGAGPAGCSAAIYIARAGLKPVIFGGAIPGGQLLMTHEIENFPGFPEPVSGADLMERMHSQCKRMGAEMLTDEVEDVDFSSRPFMLLSSSGERYAAKAVVIASGAKARWLGIDSERKFMGKGVSACATCDGFFFRGREVCVVGGGDAAAGDALFLARFASKIHLIHRRDRLRATASVASRVLAEPKVIPVWDSVVREIRGADAVESVILKNVKTGAETELPCSAVFVAIGHDPNTRLYAGKLNLDQAGYIVADGRTRTSVPGVFAAGDVMDLHYKQAVTSAGTGCMAGLEAERFIAGL
ncbi:MAG: thioredoxin-disulfide reductase [Elusimicrobiales bacterium]